MRVLNELHTTAVTRTGRRSIEAIVRVRGIDAGAGGLGFTYQWHEPRAIIVRGEDDIARVAFPDRQFNLVGAAMPVAIYLLARTLIGRRRKP